MKVLEGLKSFLSFLKDIWQNKNVLWKLSKNDLKSKFSTSFLGVVWAFIQPLVTIFVFWFIFQVGFKSPPINDIPFIAWFIPAFLVWSYFSEVLTSVTNSLMEYSYLLKRINFRVSMIPLVKIISSSFIHVAFILLIFIVNAIYNIPLSLYNLQVIYYFICTVYLLIGTGWLLSSIAVFLRDTVNLVGVFIQIGFWLTPIFWDSNTMAPTIQYILKLNPMFYICRGYRDTFIDNVWFWEHGNTTLFFWIASTMFFIFGALIFKKLRPHFVDVI